MNRTFGIASDQYIDLLWNLSFEIKPELNSGTSNKLFLQDTITELGICYSVNSKLSVYNSYRYDGQNSLMVLTATLDDWKSILAIRSNFSLARQWFLSFLILLQYNVFDYYLAAIGVTIVGTMWKPMTQLPFIHWMVKFMRNSSIFLVHMKSIFMVPSKYRTYHGNVIHLHRPIIRQLNYWHWKFWHRKMLKGITLFDLIPKAMNWKLIS